MTSAACDSIASAASNAAINRATCLARIIYSGSRVGCTIAGDTPAATAKSRITLRCCRRRGRWRGSRSAEIKIHRRRRFRARLCGEKRPRRKTEHARDQIGRETAHCNVVVLHRGVEVYVLARYPVLGSFELRLQAEKILVGTQFRITLDHHQQTRERIA